MPQGNALRKCPLPKPEMKAEEFAKLREELDLSLAKIGKRLKVHWRTVQRWQNGDLPVPGPVAVAMRFFKWQKDYNEWVNAAN